MRPVYSGLLLQEATMPANELVLHLKREITRMNEHIYELYAHIGELQKEKTYGNRFQIPERSRAQSRHQGRGSRSSRRPNSSASARTESTSGPVKLITAAGL